MTSDKLLADHRRSLGDFEAIEFVDEAALARLRDEVAVSIPLELRWSWDYADQLAEMRELYEKGKRGQWNASSGLDWECPLPRDQWFYGAERPLLLPWVLSELGRDDATCREAARDEFTHNCSQNLHADQAVLMLAGQLTNLCPSMDAKLVAALQLVDEARHAEVLARFLQSKLGVLYPVAPTLKSVYEHILTTPSWKAKLLGSQCLLEATALYNFGEVVRTTTNPLVRDIYRRMHVDEARHAAFGYLAMQQVVEESTTEELAELEDFAFSIAESWNANQQLDMLHELGPKYGLDPAEVTHTLLSREDWLEDNSAQFMHTAVPNLRRLGLITERTEAKWRRIGAMSGASPTRPA